MSVIRAFIAADLPEDLRHALDRVMRHLKSELKGVPIRWVPPENIHLTLKFLGEVSQRNLPFLIELLQGEVADQRPFEFGVGGLGAFPDVRRPRVIWVGVKGPKELHDLHHAVENAMEKIGYARETRPFEPHLTLGRVSRNASPEEVRRVSEVLRAVQVGFLGSALVEEVYLYRSDLRPTGAVYTRLATAPLRRTNSPAVA